jgi:hypothetical protein
MAFCTIRAPSFALFGWHSKAWLFVIAILTHFSASYINGPVMLFGAYGTPSFAPLCAYAIAGLRLLTVFTFLAVFQFAV